MNTLVAKMLLEDTSLTPAEKSYVEKIDNEAFTFDREIKANELLTQLYVAKLNEKSAASSSKSALIMNRLTWIIAGAAVAQAIATFFH